MRMIRRVGPYTTPTVVSQQWCYTPRMPTTYPRVGVTKDPELARALRTTRTLLPSGDVRSEAGHVRRLALIGARALADSDAQVRDRERLLALTGARAAQESFGALAERLLEQPVDRRAELSRSVDWVRGER